MTHDKPARRLLPEGAVRLWVRTPETPSHWLLIAAGSPEHVAEVFADVGIHFPHDERLILPAGESPCGKPAPCDLCWRPAEYHGRALETGNRVLLCPRCLERAKQ